MPGLRASRERPVRRIASHAVVLVLDALGTRPAAKTGPSPLPSGERAGAPAGVAQPLKPRGGESRAVFTLATDTTAVDRQRVGHRTSIAVVALVPSERGRGTIRTRADVRKRQALPQCPAALCTPAEHGAVEGFVVLGHVHVLIAHLELSRRALTPLTGGSRTPTYERAPRTRSRAAPLVLGLAVAGRPANHNTRPLADLALAQPRLLVHAAGL
jgi:hypothetical protein